MLIGAPAWGRADAGDLSRPKLTRCVNDWPAPPAWQWRAPIPSSPRHLWTKWISANATVSPRVVTTGTKLAITVKDTLFLVERDGTPSPGSAAGAVEVLTAPVADRRDRTYSAGAAAYAYDAKGNLSFWRSPFSRPLANEWSTCSDVTLSPAGLLLTTANDGFLYAVRTSDGQLIWKQQLFSTGHSIAAQVGPGVGDAFVVNYTDKAFGQFQGQPGSRLHDRDTGQPLGPLLGPTGAGLWVDAIGPQGFVAHDSAGGFHLVDRCGALKWSVKGHADAPPRSSLVLPDGKVLAAGPIPDQSYRVSVFSANGRREAGPVDWGRGGLPIAIGADGALYALSCTEAGDEDPPALLVFNRRLKLVTRVDLGLQRGSNGFYACPQAGVTITEDGVMYLVAVQPSATATTRSGVLMIALQTTSPGVPRGGWPLAAHDPRGTRWFAP